MKPVKYQACYLWECPECGTTWQARHRPRSGAQLVCAALAEQRIVRTHILAGPTFRGCAAISISAGRRGGIAPNL